METVGKSRPMLAQGRASGRLLWLMGFLVWVSASNAPCRAATLHTNAVFDVSLTLSGYVQDVQTFVLGPTNVVFFLTALPATVANDKLLSSLYAAVPPKFSGATLLFRTTDAGTSDAATAFILRKGTNNYDLGSLMAFSLPPEFPTVSAISNLTASTTNEIDRTIMRFVLSTPDFNFDLQGLTTFNSSSIVGSGRVISAEPFPTRITSAVAGSGVYKHQTLTFDGTMLLSNRRVEVESRP
jgi:hypothetical protein